MFCKMCGKEMNENQVICLGCGCAKGTGTKFCANCGKELTENAFACLNCGVSANFGSQKGNNNFFEGDWCPEGKEKSVAILLALFLGGFGIHNFYLGESRKGVLKILTSFILVGGILAFVDLIKMLMGSYEVDSEKYI